MLGASPSTEYVSGIHPEVPQPVAQVIADDSQARPVREPIVWGRRCPRIRLATHLAPLRTGLALAVADLAAASCCTALAVAAARLCGIPLGFGLMVPLALCAGLLIGNLAFGLYPGIGVNPVIEARQIVVSSTAVFTVTCFTLQAARLSGGTAFFLVFAWLLSLFVLPVARMTSRSVLGRCAWWRQPIVILGDGVTAQRVAARLRRWRTLGLEPIGHVERLYHARSGLASDAPSGRAISGESTDMCPPQEIAELIEQGGVQWAILAAPDLVADGHPELVSCALSFPNVLIVDEACTLPSLWSRTVDIDGCTARHSHHYFGFFDRRFKRAFDVAAAALLMVLLMPVFLLIVGLIRLSSRGPVLYSQERVGRGGRPFRAWKFRTMVSGAEGVLADYLQAHPELDEEWARNHKLRDDPRVIGGVGRFLRNFSLDELPQLWNVLRGEMSLVGPRPIVEEEIPKYHDDFAMYVQVAPGITGLWQISGRNNTTYARRVFLDGYYVRNWSPWLDFYILLRTFKTVVLREGAY